MRTFIAIKLPEEVSAKLKPVVSQLNTSSAKMTFVKDFHLTLKFLGEVDASRIEELKKTLAKVKFEAFEAEFTNLGFFPNENYVRIIYIGLKPEQQFCSLQKTIESALPKFKKDSRFEPHITLARVKFIKDKAEFKNAISKIKLPEFPKFKVDCFKLMKSTLMPEGPVYEELATVQP